MNNQFIVIHRSRFPETARAFIKEQARLELSKGDNVSCYRCHFSGEPESREFASFHAFLDFSCIWLGEKVESMLVGLIPRGMKLHSGLNRFQVTRLYIETVLELLGIVDFKLPESASERPAVFTGFVFEELFPEMVQSLANRTTPSGGFIISATETTLMADGSLSRRVMNLDDPGDRSVLADCGMLPPEIKD
jgi:hypothetical protein